MEKSLREAYGEVLVELGKENKNMVVVAADLAGSTKVDKFGQFPERFFDFGVAEPDALTTCAGLAHTGKIVFFSTFAVFGTGLIWGQIRQNICYPNLSVKIVCTHGGLTVGADGASHQALEDIAIMRVLPNMKVIVPADAYETKVAVRAALKIPGPVYIRLSRPEFPVIYNEDVQFELGKAKVHSYGRDATIFACGLMVSEALKAQKELEQNYDLEVGVVNMSSIKPIDKEAILRAAQASKMLVVAEEHSIIGGLGSAVAEVLSEYGVGRSLKRVGVLDCFGESGEPEELLRKFGVSKEKMVEIISSSISKYAKVVAEMMG